MKLNKNWLRPQANPLSAFLIEKPELEAPKMHEVARRLREQILTQNVFGDMDDGFYETRQVNDHGQLNW
jgi:hypothetical protein